jgi:glycosyltransferase involved in cell wall biosynthesis
MIFLDHRFTIPNFPSRLLVYMQAQIPVLAVTDPNTDVGEVIAEGGFGWWCESNDVERFRAAVQQILNTEQTAMGKNGWNYLMKEYTAEKAFKIIMKHF